MGYGGYKLRVRNLKKMNIQLLKQVHERTRDIASQTKAIEKQTEELKRLNSIKDKLFSIISHDLKSPLNSLVGILKLLNVGSLSQEELRTLTGKLEVEVEGLSAMLTNLLSWAKTQMKGISAKPVNIDLKELVDENIQLASSDARKKNIEIKNHISNTGAYADKEMVNLVFRNLISNAVKFTDQEGQIEIKAKSNGEFVRISVKDNGLGISEDNAAKLFSDEEHYSMLGTSREAGTGLGLLLCKEFVEKNGGKIWVESELGKGSNFMFEIPKKPDKVKMDTQLQDSK
jgi:signal transduction histidine kinase